MTTTCASCGAELGDAAACPRCGTRVLSPQSSNQSSNQPDEDVSFDWRSDTAERPAIRLPVEPAPATGLPIPPRFPLYADEAEESVSAHVELTPVHRPAPYSPRDPTTGDETTAAAPPGCRG